MASPFYRECFLEVLAIFFFFFLVLAIRNRFRMRPPLMHVENTCVEVGELA